VDLGQRARILMEGNDEARAFGVLSGLHVACAVGAFVPALVLGSTRGERRRHPLGVGGVVTLSLLALGAVGFLGVYAQSLGTVAKEAATLHAPSYPVSLPVVKNLGATHPMSGHAVVFTKQDNVLERLEKDVSLYPGRYTFAADRDARVVALIALLEARDVQGSRLELVVTEEHPAPPPRDIDPDVLAMLGPEPLVVSVSIGGSSARVPSITFQSGNQSLGVQRVHGELVGVELGPNLQKDLYEALGEAPDVVTIYVEGKTTVGALSQVIDALASSQRGPDVRVGVTGYTEERLAPLRGRR
jgi:hypothetical protein